jgi:hypothetical protein
MTDDDVLFRVRQRLLAAERERRRLRMPNQAPPWLEERVVAFALGHPRQALQLHEAGALRIGGDKTVEGGQWEPSVSHAALA